jgi:hypothetical protein
MMNECKLMVGWMSGWMDGWMDDKGGGGEQNSRIGRVDENKTLIERSPVVANIQILPKTLVFLNFVRFLSLTHSLVH